MKQDDSIRAGRPVARATPAASVSRFRWARGRPSADLGWSVGTAFVSVLAATLVMRLWHITLAVPITGYNGDATLNNVVVKDVLDHGWYDANQNLAAPYGQHLYDFSAFSADSLQIAALGLLGVVFGGWGAAVNVYFLLSFPLLAVVAYGCLRRLRLTPPVAAVTATLFVFLPYHFARGLGGHLFLSTYYSVPLGALLALSVLLGEPVFERGERSGRVGQWASRRTFLSLGMCIVIGSCGLYYAFFTDLLLALAAGLTLAVRRRSDAIASCVALAVIACTVALTFVPNLAYRAIHGPNPAVAHRVPFESEVFATKLTHLVLPVPGDRISPLRRLRVRYDSTSPPPQDYGSALGLIGAAGVFVMIVTLLLSALPQAANVRRRLRATSLLGVFTILVITVGGISSLIAYVVTPQIRAWYRDSIFVGFFALLAVALLLERILRGRSRWVVLGVVGLLLAFGLFEQTTDNSIPTYASARAEYDSDAVLVREIESRLPDRGSVFQLPYIAFPEAASVGAADVYAGGRGYLHSHDLRWSWGSIEGRREDWQAALAGRPVGAVIRAVAAAGFDGLWLDRDGFPASWPALERRVTRLTGAVPLVSPDRHISFFDLRRFRARERSALGQKRVRALRAATLEPVSTIWSPSFYDADLTAGGSRRWSASSLAQVMLESPAGAIRVAFAALASSKRPGVLTVAWPDGTHTRVAVSQTPVPLRHRFAVPGRSGPPATITFTTTATPVRDEAGTRTLYFALDDAAVTPVFPR